MNKIVTTAIFTVAMMMSVNFVSGQNQDTYNNSGSQPEFDDMYVTFVNMGNLPPGTVTITWYHNINLYHPNPWLNSKSFVYPGEEGTYYYSDYPNWNPRNWTGFKVTVLLGGKYIATKSWDGDNSYVTFTQDDFDDMTRTHTGEDNGYTSPD